MFELEERLIIILLILFTLCNIKYVLMWYYCNKDGIGHYNLGDDNWEMVLLMD